jgi:hypothetical protein
VSVPAALGSPRRGARVTVVCCTKHVAPACLLPAQCSSMVRPSIHFGVVSHKPWYPMLHGILQDYVSHATIPSRMAWYPARTGRIPFNCACSHVRPAACKRPVQATCPVIASCQRGLCPQARSSKQASAGLTPATSAPGLGTGMVRTRRCSARLRFLT